MDFENITDKILATDDAMRFVGIVDSKGNTIFSKMNKQKKDIHNEESKIMISHDLNIMRQMHNLYNESFGKVTKSYITREKVNMIAYYLDNGVVCATLERDIDEHKVVDIARRIEPILKGLIF